MAKTVLCGLCNNFTDDTVYRGRLQCCSDYVFFGLCCKEKAVMLFDSLGAAGVAFAKLHTFACKKKDDVIVDETEELAQPEPAKSLNASEFQKIRERAASQGQIIDGSWVLVIPKGDKKAMVARMFGDGFEFAKAEKPEMCGIEGDFLGVFEGVPVMARWDVVGDNAVLCRQSMIGNTPDRLPPN